MKTITAGLALSAFIAAAGCGDDTTAGTGGGGGASASSGATTTSAATSTSQAASTTTGSGDGGQGGEASGSTTTTGIGGTGTGGAGGGAGGGQPSTCDDLATGPFEPVLVTSAFDGSEDIAFDGLGHLAGKQGSTIILLDGDGNETVLFDDEPLPDAFGMRFAPDGSLVVALPGVGEVVAFDADGSANVLADDFSGPNGIHVTMDGTVWVTELPAGRIQTIAPGAGFAEPFLDSGDAPAVNGIYVDEDRGIVFFTNYSAGELWRVDIGATEAPTLVAGVDGALFDGLSMDACGNVYAVDQGNARVYRVRTDGNGDATAEPELIATLPTGVANAQFGRGAGFDATTLYAAGNPGDVYAIAVGIEGAEQAGP